MFKYEFQHELKYWAKNGIVYFYVLTFVGVGALTYAGTLGFFDPVPDSYELNRWINSYSGINSLLLYYHKLLLILLPSIVGVSLHKDYKSRVHSIIYSFPIAKKEYLLGRLSASLLIVVIISMLVVMGFALVEQLPGLNTNRLGPFNSLAYAQVFLIYIVPNWLIFGLITFSVIMLTRNIYTGYGVIIIPILIQLITENLFAGNGFLIALSDPFAQNVASYYQQDWDIVTQNQQTLPVEFLLISNRLVWLGVAIGIFYYAYRKFQFVEDLPLGKNKRMKKHSTQSKNISSASLTIKTITKEFSFRLILLASWKTTQKSIYQIIKSPIFWLLCVLGLLAVVFMILRVTQKEEFVLVPATQFIVGVPLIVFSMIIVLATFIYSGLLIHLESNVSMDHLIAVTPMPSIAFIVGKIAGVLAMQFMMLTIFMGVCIGLQLTQSYFEVNISLYFQSLYIHTFIPLITWALVSIFIHLIINNFYAGIFLLFLGWTGIQGLQSIGVDSYLLRFNELPRLTYSAFNGFGRQEFAYLIVVFYWFSFGLLLFLMSILIYRRGLINHLQDFKKMVQSSMNRWFFLTLSIPILLIIFFGFIIYEEEQQVKLKVKNQDQQLALFKEQFEPFRGLPLPKIYSLTAKIELYPEAQRFECTGKYELINHTKEIIDTLLFKTGFDEITQFEFDREFEILMEDQNMKVYLIKFREGLAPADTLSLGYSIQSQSNTMFEQNNNVLSNGTFLKADIFPRIGYDFDTSLPDPTDSLVRATHYQAIDSDKVFLDLTIGTAPDQIALAPGNLIREWKSKDRSYFQYQTEQPVKFSFGINSGKFLTQTFHHSERSIVIYYLHSQMIPSIVSGVQAAIAFNEKYFSAYPYKVTRVIEFPLSEGTYATAFANNLIVSELRFLSQQSNNEKKVDIAFYVAAHEMTHHWWGNQLLPARAKGATMLTESITEYLMLRLLEEYKGTEVSNAFYKLQRERYLTGIRNNTREEPPLILAAPEEQYITYGKGAITLYDLSEQIGVKQFNHLLILFFDRYSGASPYPTTVDFMDFLLSNTDTALHAKIHNALAKVE